jgi:aminopeptidase N
MLGDLTTSWLLLDLRDRIDATLEVATSLNRDRAARTGGRTLAPRWALAGASAHAAGRSRWPVGVFILALTTSGCAQRPVPSPLPAGQDILTTALQLDLSSLNATADVLVRADDSSGAIVLDVGGLTIDSVRLEGAPVGFTVAERLLRVPVEGVGDAVNLEIAYSFPERQETDFDGWMPSLGVSFVWPSYCGNLFPCDPDPTDGVTFSMEVSGLAPELTAIYPTSTVAEAPSYMPAVAVGPYERLGLGATEAGTSLSAWYLPGADALPSALAGTAHLVAAFDFFERTYGAYAFGAEAGTVEVDWGSDSWGGMEHHPFFHVARFDFGNEEAQVHEAAHGWFGDGVRIACWEDFVLSEGTTTYITARALEQVGGPDLWPYYVDEFLVPICSGLDTNAVVLPDGCGDLDFESSDLWSLAPYMKGACFYGEVADLIGADLLDQLLREFYEGNVGSAARMGQMLDLLASRAAPAAVEQLDRLVSEWLLTRACPADYAARCRSRAR